MGLLCHRMNATSIGPVVQYELPQSGLENSARPLVFTSASGCRASEIFDVSSIN